MSQEDRDERLAELLREYHRRRADGATPDPSEFREAAGNLYAEFRDLVGAEDLLAAVPDARPATEDLPRPFGEYTLLEVLGRGGVGVVYHAVQKSLTRHVALKRLRVGWEEESKLLRRFREGARAAARVEHDHAVRIYDYGVVDGSPYLVMNQLAGPTLGEILRRLGEIEAPPFGPAHHAVLDESGVPGGGSDTVAYVRRIAGLLAGPTRALDRYHRSKIVHRDVKPANLMMDGEGRLVAMDFDLVKRLDATTQITTRSALGTPLYMSPEQWTTRYGDLDGRADVYALGAVLYETLALRRPFDERDPGVLMRRTLGEAPVDPGKHVEGLPLDARRVALKCLEKRPEDRYATATDLARELEALAAGTPVRARPVARTVRLARAARKRWKPLLALLMILLAAGIWWILRPVYVELNVIPRPVAGEVFLAELEDGETGREEHLGEAPVLNRMVRPGTYRVRVAVEGLEDTRQDVRMSSDEKLTVIRPVLTFASSDQVAGFTRREFADVYDKLEDRVRKLREEAEEAAIRGPSDLDWPVLIHPRGRMPVEDIREYAVELDGILVGDLVLRDASGADLHRSPVRLTRAYQSLPLPDGFRRAVVPGRTYRWGFEPEGGETRMTSFEAVGDPVEDLLRDAARDASPDSEELARILGILRLQERELHVSAWLRARTLAETWPVAEVQALGLRSLDALGLAWTVPWKALYEPYEKAEAERRNDR